MVIVRLGLAGVWEVRRCGASCGGFCAQVLTAEKQAAAGLQFVTDSFPTGSLVVGGGSYPLG